MFIDNDFMKCSRAHKIPNTGGFQSFVRKAQIGISQNPEAHLFSNQCEIPSIICYHFYHYYHSVNVLYLFQTSWNNYITNRVFTNKMIKELI